MSCSECSSTTVSASLSVRDLRKRGNVAAHPRPPAEQRLEPRHPETREGHHSSVKNRCTSASRTSMVASGKRPRVRRMRRRSRVMSFPTLTMEGFRRPPAAWSSLGKRNVPRRGRGWADRGDGGHEAVVCRPMVSLGRKHDGGTLFAGAEVGERKRDEDDVSPPTGRRRRHPQGCPRNRRPARQGAARPPPPGTGRATVGRPAPAGPCGRRPPPPRPQRLALLMHRQIQDKKARLRI